MREHAREQTSVRAREGKRQGERERERKRKRARERARGLSFGVEENVIERERERERKCMWILISHAGLERRGGGEYSTILEYEHDTFFK